MSYLLTNFFRIRSCTCSYGDARHIFVVPNCVCHLSSLWSHQYKNVSITIVQVSMYDILGSWILCRIYLYAHKSPLTYWARVTHICVDNQTIIGSDNGLLPGRRQAITWTNVGILLIGPIGTNFNEMLIEIHTFSFKKMHLKMSSGKWRPFCLGLNMLNAVFFSILQLMH